MGRRKKKKWWHQQSQPEPSGRFLKAGDTIRAGDHFLSVGKYYPVSSTIGTEWHAALPPMWRGPLPGANQNQREHVIISTRHQEFIDMMEMAGFPMPHQFNQWRRFFLDEKNFLDEAEHWLSMRLQGRFAKIEDDVDKGLMSKHGSSLPESHPRANTATSGWNDDDDYWDAWRGWSGHRKVSRYSMWADPVLPLTPKIAAPSGKCGVELVIL